MACRTARWASSLTSCSRNSRLARQLLRGLTSASAPSAMRVSSASESTQQNTDEVARKAEELRVLASNLFELLGRFRT